MFNIILNSNTYVYNTKQITNAKSRFLRVGGAAWEVNIGTKRVESKQIISNTIARGVKKTIDTYGTTRSPHNIIYHTKCFVWSVGVG